MVILGSKWNGFQRFSEILHALDFKMWTSRYNFTFLPLLQNKNIIIMIFKKMEIIVKIYDYENRV